MLVRRVRILRPLLILDEPTRSEVEAIIPEGVQVVLHEESLTHIHLTIPTIEELSEADLELVAGGAWGTSSSWDAGDGWSCV